VVAVITSTEAPIWAVGLQLAPNPTPGTLFINAEAWPESGSLGYRLVNALGQEMNNGLWAVGAGNWRQTLDMSRLPAGTYWLQLGWNDELWTQKVIKQ
ncbi:MAG: T9SS type A sorting domain-containing protein, partial [Bacteroidota bacterium]